MLLLTPERLVVPENDQRVIIGIDPDSNGALAALTDSGGMAIMDTPTLDTRTSTGKKRTVCDQDQMIVEFEQLVTWLGSRNVHVLVEDVRPTPSFGRKSDKGDGEKASFGNSNLSSFLLGQVKSSWTMIAKVNNFSISYVTPQLWKRRLGLWGKTKDDSLRMAKDLFPDLREWLKFKYHHGRAEALLIAHFAKYCQ